MSMMATIIRWWEGQGLTVPQSGTYAYSMMIETYVREVEEKKPMKALPAPARRKSNRKVMGC